MATNPAPITQSVLDENGVPTLPWTLFFNQNFEGDAGTEWDANFVGLTEVGGDATITGRYYRISQYLVFFKVLIEPATNTSATSGTTYIDNFPLQFSGDGFNTVVSGTAGGSLGINRSADNRIYVPSWTVITQPLTVLGFGEAR